MEGALGAAGSHTLRRKRTSVQSRSTSFIRCKMIHTFLLGS